MAAGATSPVDVHPAGRTDLPAAPPSTAVFPRSL